MCAGAFPPTFPQHDGSQALTGRFAFRYGMGDGMLSGFEIEPRGELGGRHGSQRHSSDANQAQVVQPPECRRGVDARTSDRDDAGLLEARDRRIDLSGWPIL